MGRKHLKKLRSEKSKVHLRKKFLPKGQNVTDTTFTVKKILTVEQLKSTAENEPVSNWNVPLKDLLVRLNHYNVTSRLNGLSGIKEILSKYPETLKGPSLKSLVCRLLELITDEEQRVRVAMVELLKYLFGLIPSASIAPFHDILNVYVRCAMTHRSATVQLDSLKLVDVMIKYSPEAVKNNFRSIAQNFTRIVKNHLFNSHVNIFTSGCKQNLEKKRVEMLLRLYEFLVVGCSANKDEKEPICKSNINVLAKCKIPLRNSSNQYKKVPNLSSMFKSSEDKCRSMTEFDSSEFKWLCSVTIPLVFDLWAEFSQNELASECVLSGEIGELLSVLLKILLVFYLKVKTLSYEKMELWFVADYGPGFQKLFTSNFPYLSSVSKKESESKFEFLGELNNFVMQNLIICYLSYLFKVVPKNSNLEKKVKNYLSGILTLTDPEEVEILSKVIELVINNSSYETSKIILDKVVSAYSTTKNSVLQLNLFKILSKIVLNENGCICHNNSSLVNWTKSLPNLLGKSEISMYEIETILKLISKPIGIDVLREVESKAEEITRNLPNVKVCGVLQLEGQKMIANILYKCNKAVVEELIRKKILDSALYSEDLRNYIMNIFSQKLKF